MQINKQVYGQQEYKKLRQTLINNNPQILNKLLQIYKQHDKIEQLEFIRREQRINNNRIFTKIPAIQNTIEKISQEIRQKQQMLKNKQKQIMEIDEETEKIRVKIQKVYMKHRQNKGQIRMLNNQISKLKRKRMGEQGKSLGKQVKKYLGQKNNQNSNLNGLSAAEYKMMQMQKMIRVRTQKQVLSNKIIQMKQEIKYKMGLLDEQKEERKRLTLELGGKKMNSLIGSRKMDEKSEGHSLNFKSLR